MSNKTDLKFIDEMVKKYQCRGKRNWARSGFLRVTLAPIMLAMQQVRGEVTTITSQEPLLSETTCPQQQLPDLACVEKEPGAADDANNTKVWNRTAFTLAAFDVAGVNLGQYGQQQQGETIQKVNQDALPFELYEDFNMEHLITGNEGWDDLIEYRRLLERPSLSFYVDKVARKRWLPTIGVAQPYFYALNYGEELGSGKDDDETMTAILNRLPVGTDYAAKPSHHSSTSGVWLVSHNVENNSTSFTRTAQALEEDSNFNQAQVAASLARNIKSEVPFKESWALKHVKPGFVVEERFTALEGDHLPPLEFNIFTIWGRVWVGQMNIVDDEGRFNEGFVYRDGTMAKGSFHKEFPLDWLDWDHLVDIAERLGANKDMFRTDIFVGLPAGCGGAWSGATDEDRLDAVEYVVSESEIYPTTVFVNNEVAEEAARLWIAGYKVGNYRTVPNTEVPKRFLETGSLPLE